MNPREPKPLQNYKAEVKLKQVWKKSIGSGDGDLLLQLQPVFLEGEVYALDVDGDLTVLSLDTGKKLRTHDFDESITGGLSADSRNLYYSTFEGELVAVDRTSFAQVWRHRLTSEAVAPAVSNGRQVYVPTVDGKLTSLDALSGNQVWRYDSLDPILTLRGTSSVVLANDLVVGSFANGEMIAFEQNEGILRWKSVVGLPQGRTELERLVDADGAPILIGDTLYAVAYQGKLISVDAKRGFEYWSKPLSSYHSVAPTSSEVYASDSDGLVWAFDAQSGELKWKSDALQYRRLSGPVVFGDALVTADFEGYLHFLSRDDGHTVARRRVHSDGIMGSLIVRDNRLYIVTRSGDLYCYEYR